MPSGTRSLSEDHLIERQRRVYRFWAPVYDRLYAGILADAHGKIIELASAEGGRVLEVGVGTGLLLPKYSRRCHVTGIDISNEMIARARDKIAAHGLDQVDLRVGNAQCLEFPPNSFDVVILPFVLTLLPDPEGALEECLRVLKPEGTIVIASKISDGAGVVGLVERILAPFVEAIGWSATFRSQRLLRWIDGHSSVEVIDWLSSAPVGLFKVIKLRKSYHSPVQ
ncbi:methyltransferase domain-containing protein [Pararhizobium sp. BT-229]|uniref:class I SAM-dependent methyltransferase n=1 Tax=Pararhizobium sp. BT-229 TaxID=2986923 RepID=UPI0021F6DCCC|nr:methyltransferase domain-containing protein [Pararhizobium sp. BT-229]MCV9967498.1 methyltransferase domain-containing protein [Pararhizobium sp. BT-229]